jgi:iron complex transport system substrate-binding protein
MKGQWWKRWAVISLAVSLMVVGCSNPDAQDEKESNTGAEARTVTHAMGETTIEGTPERVVLLTNDAVDDALALGVKPVGAVQSWIGDPWYDFIADEMEGVELVGEEVQPNLEKIASLEPDLIIGSKVRHEKIYDQLSAIAPTVFSETVGHVWKENFELYAEALGKKEEAKQRLNDWDAKIKEFQSEHADQLDTEVSIIRFLPGMVRIHHNGFPDSVVAEAGLSRPESQQSEEFASEVTEERIPDMDGDILFVLTFEAGDGEASKLKEEWMEKPLFKELEVVKNGNVHEVNDIYWNLSGGIQGAEKMLEDLDSIMDEYKK